MGSSFVSAQSSSRNGNSPQTQDETNVELVRARETANATEKRYQSIKRLADSGSASQKQLRGADFQRMLALIELSSVVDPNRKGKNEIVKAKLIVVFRTKEWKVARELYRLGSMTQVFYRRATTARDVAVANLKAVESATQAQQRMHAIKIAQSRLELAKQEHVTAQHLFSTGSLSQTTLDRTASSLRIAESELASAKEALGASAIRVKQ